MRAGFLLSPCDAGGGDRVAVRGASRRTAHGPRPLHHVVVPLPRKTEEERVS